MVQLDPGRLILQPFALGFLLWMMGDLQGVFVGLESVLNLPMLTCAPFGCILGECFIDQVHCLGLACPDVWRVLELG